MLRTILCLVLVGTSCITTHLKAMHDKQEGKYIELQDITTDLTKNLSKTQNLDKIISRNKQNQDGLRKNITTFFRGSEACYDCNSCGEILDCTDGYKELKKIPEYLFTCFFISSVGTIFCCIKLQE